jgi:hypothetical protein
MRIGLLIALPVFLRRGRTNMEQRIVIKLSLSAAMSYLHGLGYRRWRDRWRNEAPFVPMGKRWFATIVDNSDYFTVSFYVEHHN